MADVALSFPKPAPRRRRDGKRTAKRAALYAIAAVVLAVVLVPLVYAWLGGFRDNQQLVTKPAALPDPWVLDNYRGVLGTSSFWRQLWNSTLIALLTTGFVLPTASLAAFVLARYLSLIHI